MTWSACHQYIGAKPQFQSNVLINHRQQRSALVRYARLAQFIAETLLVDRFKQPRPEVAMHIDRKTDDAFGQGVT